MKFFLFGGLELSFGGVENLTFHWGGWNFVIKFFFIWGGSTPPGGLTDN